jgi:hypothetical protein
VDARADESVGHAALEPDGDAGAVQNGHGVLRSIELMFECIAATRDTPKQFQKVAIQYCYLPVLGLTIYW